MAGMTREEVQQLLKEQERRHRNEMSKLAQLNAESKRFNRNISIEQEKEKFRYPSEKRAIQHLMETEFDQEDFSDALAEVCSKSDHGLQVVDNVDKLRAFVEFASKFSNMTKRKLLRERECYDIARTSKHGWKTVKFYCSDPIFKDDSVDAWFEKDDESADSKTKRMRAAETEASREFYQEKRSVAGQSASASASSGESSASASVPRASFKDDICFNCNEVGHHAKYCKNPKKEK